MAILEFLAQGLKAIWGAASAGWQTAAAVAGPALAPLSGVGAVVAAKMAAVLATGAIGVAGTAAAVGLAVATISYGTYYALTGQPLSFAPGIPEVPLVGQAVKAMSPRYVFSIPGVTSPMGVAISPDGRRVYVAEGGGQRLVKVFDPNGKPQDVFQEPPGAKELLRLPAAVTTDAEGKVYVTDRIMGAVHVYRSDGVYLGPFLPQGSAGMLAEPLGITMGAKGQLYVTESRLGNHRVMVFDGSKRLQRAFGREGRDVGEFSFPNGIAVDGGGRIFVADTNNARVLIFSPEGDYQDRVPGQLGFPRGLALDKLGRLYVVDSVGGTVSVFDAKESPLKPLFSFGLPGKGDGQLQYPNGIAVDNSTGRIYVADWGNHRVSVWAY